MLNNCLQWYKVSLRTLTTEDSIVKHTYSTTAPMSCIDSIWECCVRHATGNVWLATRYTTADNVVCIGSLSAVVE